jgi:4-amino-4-deoxychorismate mutase
MSGLEPYRRRLDQLDDEIARLLGERFQICREVAGYKSANEIPMMQPERVMQVRARYLSRGAEVQLPRDFSEAMFELMIAATCKLEDELMEAHESEGLPEDEDAVAEDASALADEASALAEEALALADEEDRPDGDSVNGAPHSASPPDASPPDASPSNGDPSNGDPSDADPLDASPCAGETLAGPTADGAP